MKSVLSGMQSKRRSGTPAPRFFFIIATFALLATLITPFVQARPAEALGEECPPGYVMHSYQVHEDRGEDLALTYYAYECIPDPNAEPASTLPGVQLDADTLLEQNGPVINGQEFQVPSVAPIDSLQIESPSPSAEPIDDFQSEEPVASEDPMLGEPPMDPQTGEIHVFKYLCPQDGTDYSGLGWDQLGSLCVTYGDGIAFEILGPVNAGGNVGNSEAGKVLFSGLPSGAYDLYEYQPDGYTGATVFCNQIEASGAETGFGQYPVDDFPSIDVQVPVAGDVYCHWYNWSGFEAAAQDGEIVVRKWICPDVAMEVGDTVADQLATQLANCTVVHDGVEFTLNAQGGFSDTQITGADGEPGAIRWDVAGLEPGAGTIVETISAGYGTPIVFCTFEHLVSTDQGPISSYNLERFDPADGTVPFAIPAEGTYTVVCDWFNMPTGDGQIIIYKWICEDLPLLRTVAVETDERALIGPAMGEDAFAAPSTAGVVLDDAEPTDDLLDVFTENCTEVGVDFEFQTEVSDGAIVIYDETRTTEADGSATFEDVPAGSATITETLPVGYLGAFMVCTMTLADGTELPPFFGSTFEGGLEAFDFPTGAKVVCQWFNIPSPEIELEVVKHLCPVGYERPVFGEVVRDVRSTERILTDEVAIDPDDLAGIDPGDDPSPTPVTPEDLFEDCAELGEDWEYTLSGDGGFIDVQTTGADGVADFGIVPADDLTLTETLPAGYGTPVVFCQMTFGDELSPWFPVEVLGSSIELPFGGIPYSATIVCHWFNFPHDDDGSGDITIFKFFCPEGLDTTGFTEDQYFEFCTEVATDIDFTLEQGDRNETQTTDAAGQVSFTELDGQIFTITEDIPAGYGDPVIFCRWGAIFETPGGPVAVDGFVPLQTLPGGVFEYQFPYENTGMGCYWFNIPQEDGIIIYKYSCPAGVVIDPANYLEDLAEKCTEPMAGIEFDLEDGDGTEQATTDAGGVALFTDIAEGTVKIIETIPDGYGTPGIWCIDAEGNPWILEQFEGTIGGTWAGLPVVCYWYNFPHDDGIDIFKYVCPEGVVFESPTQHELQELCTEPGAGIEFEFGDSDGDGVELATTDGTGKVGFEDVADGDFSIVEFVPDGYTVPYIYCFYADGTPFDSEQGGPSIKGSYDGRYIVCYWYNVPDHDYVNLIVEKYSCPEEYVGATLDDYKNACVTHQDGIEFEVERGSTGETWSRLTGTDGAGKAVFGGLTPAEGYEISEDVPVGTWSIAMSCVVGMDEIELPLFNMDENSIGLTLPEEGTVICYWFNVPEDGGYTTDGKVTVIKYWCSGVVYAPVACAADTGGTQFELSPLAPGTDRTLTTLGNGQVTVSVPAGSYELTEIGKDWCRAESSSVDENGNVLVQDGKEAVVTVYNCGKDPGNSSGTTTKGPLVTKFVNTGTGTTAEAAVEVAQSWTIVASLGFAALALAAIARRREVHRIIRIAA